MQNSLLSPSAQKTKGVRPYRCSSEYFIAGFIDWLKESFSDTSLTSPSAKDPSYWGATLVVLGGLFVSAAIVVSWVSPTLVSGLGLIGWRNVTKACAALSESLAAAVAVGLPVFAGIKMWRFSGRMCQRGWELKTGQRKPFSYS